MKQVNNEIARKGDEIAALKAQLDRAISRSDQAQISNDHEGAKRWGQRAERRDEDLR